jgi:integral membrane protein (TIGR00529 family)
MSILSLPIIVKVLGSLAVILILSRFFKKLYLPILLGSVMLAVWCGFTVTGMVNVIQLRLLDMNNLFLLLTISQIITLSNQMSKTGVMKELVVIIRRHISQRAAMAVLPAIIGFLPMPGGAIFSAPLVDDCDQQQNIDPMIKTKINYWFRHIWEYWWPLYPGVLLAIEISGLSTWQFMLIQLPFCIFAIFCGYIFLLRRIPTKEKNKTGKKQQLTDYYILFKLLAPIFTVIIVAIVVKMIYPRMLDISRFMPIAIGLCCAVALLQWQRPLSLKIWSKMIFTKALISLLLVVVSIRFYGAFISADLPNGASLVETMRQELCDLGIPVVLIIMMIPFITGFTTGIAIGFVGASFPIVFSLLGTDPQLSELLAANVLAFGFGYMGMILSPVHVCLIVSNQHFKTAIAGSLRGLMKPAIIMLCFTFIYYVLIKLF